MLRALVMQYALGERYANSFLNRLGSTDRLLRICGLECAPSEGAYSRFKKETDSLYGCHLAHHSRGLSGVRHRDRTPAGDRPGSGGQNPRWGTRWSSTALMLRHGRGLGEQVVGRVRRFRRRTRTPKWGHRTAKNVRTSRPRSSKRGSAKASKRGTGGDAGSGRKESKDEFYFGYKVDAIADSNHGLPLFAATRSANANDQAVMIQDVDDCLALYGSLEPRYFLGDKGYDALKNIEHVVDLGMIPVIAVRSPAKDKETGKRMFDGIYDEEGRPTCIGGRSMDYVETDPDQGHLFRCPADGCSLKKTIQFTKHCDYEHHEKPEGSLVRIVGLLPRCSDAWKAEYRKRPIIERYFSSDKHSRLLGTHRYLNIQKVSLHSALATLSYLATALAT